MSEIKFPALDEIERELKQVFDEAGSEMDYRNVKSRQFNDNTEFAAWLKRKNDQLDELRTVKTAAERGTGLLSGSENGQRDDYSRRYGSDVYGEAKRVIDSNVKSGLLPDYAAEHATELVEKGRDEERSLAARWVKATGSPAYFGAFQKLFADPLKGHLLWTAEEADAYRHAKAIGAELKAPLGTGATAGEELIPLSLDPAIMLTSDGSINPLRRVCRVVRTASNVWHGVTSAGSTAEWKAEHAQAADATPAVADLAIPVHFGDADVLYSYEIAMDALDFQANISRVAIDAAAQLQNTAFTTGSGSGQPAGIVTGATGVNNAAGAFVSADVFTLQNSLPPRFQEGNAQWAANLAVINKMAQMETSNGHLMFPELREGRLLRKPLNELSNMSSDFATTGEKFLLYADMSQFIIVDRIGTTVEILPNYGAAGRPTGQRHFFLYFRTGSKVAIASAIRVLVKTA